MIVEIDSYFLEYVRQHDLFDKMMKNLISQYPMRNKLTVEDDVLKSIINENRNTIWII